MGSALRGRPLVAGGPSPKSELPMCAEFGVGWSDSILFGTVSTCFPPGSSRREQQLIG